MKVTKIDPNHFTVNQYEETIKVKDFSIIGLIVEGEKSASIFNVLTVDSEKERYIGIKTQYLFSEPDDVNFAINTDINLFKMEKEIQEKAKSLMSAIKEEDMWYTSISPIKWEDDQVTIQGYHKINGIKVECDIVLPIGVYLLLSKVRSDTILHIPTNPYYCFTDPSFKYTLKHINHIEYLGSEFAGKEDEDNKIVSMYHITGKDSDYYLTVPFSMDKEPVIKKQLTIKEFTEQHNEFINFDISTFFYYEDPREDALADAFVMYNADEKEYIFFNVSNEVSEAIFGPDKEVSE